MSASRRCASLQAFIDTVNTQYATLHVAYERQFWGTKMALKSKEFSKHAENETKLALDNFLGDEKLLSETRSWLKDSSADTTEDQRKCLELFERTFQTYIVSNEEAKHLKETTMGLEGDLEQARATMKLGFTGQTGTYQEVSSVGLRNRMRTSQSEPERKSAYDGLRSIGNFITANGFPEIVKQRNRTAKLLGFVDYYDWKVTAAEGFGKTRLFEILDTLENETRPIMTAAREALASDKGPDALQPWNSGFATAGDITAKLDPYFPFEKAVEMFGRSYAKLGIQYKQAVMHLDLLDRQGKYSNGFCHWPECAWRKPDGTWQPSRTNFTSLADPKAIGSGMSALNTLMHEAGHAAHFANIDQPSPLFSQERAPTSVAYAENQSMFLDSLVGDAAWRGRYAVNRQGEPVPWELLEEDIRAKHPYKVFALRAMLSVPYFEKALYELPESEVTAERILELADKIEDEIQGGLSPRPLLSVPHIISDEASCYYHGYVLAEMSVHQTRAHFLSKYGRIVDNEKVGKEIAEAYWRPGNSVPFLTLVRELTGSELTGKTWVSALRKTVDEHCQNERKEYDEAVKALQAQPYKATDSIELDMHMVLVDGDDVLADSSVDGGFLGACHKFEEIVAKRVSQD